MSGRRVQILRNCAVGLALATLFSCAGSSRTSERVRAVPAEENTKVGASFRASGARRASPRRKRRSSPRGIWRKDIDRILDAGPGALLARVPLQPIFGKGRQFSGFSIVSVFENRPEALRYGAQPGDVVVSINGQRILTPADLLEVFRLLRNATRLEIDLLRSSRPVKIRVPILDPSDVTQATSQRIGALKEPTVKTCSRYPNVSTLRHSPTFVTLKRTNGVSAQFRPCHAARAAQIATHRQV